MSATLDILKAAGARLDIETIRIGEQEYLAGNSSGIAPEAWESLLRTKVFLKAPISTPQGGGYKSLNVTTRKNLSLFANVRPCISYHPYVKTKHPKMDIVIVRENEEDLYGGIEHRQTNEVIQTLKLISRPGCEKIIRYAFEYARLYNRKKVTCFTKDNIMKQTDGLFHKVFDEIAAEYPDIANEHMIIDIGSAKLADTPEIFDVIVTLNLYGDIISDIAAQLAGSLGIAGAANIGAGCAMFEAIHGSAPRRAGQNMANPSGLLQAAVLMLVHIGQGDTAEKVQNAWLKTLEDGIHTYDIYKEGLSTAKAGTKEFSEAVIARLGQKPGKLKPVSYKTHTKRVKMGIVRNKPAPKKETVGVDIFFDWASKDINALADAVKSACAVGLHLKFIANRGISVWPSVFSESVLTDHFQARIIADESEGIHLKIAQTQTNLAIAGIDFVKTEHLCTFNGKDGFTLGRE